MRRVTDQMGRDVEVPAHPRRVVSLVPSQTELLFDLGLGDRVVGVTRYCVHPPGPCASTPKVGGTKRVHLDRLAALSPDLVIGNKEENTREDIEALAERYPVWMSDVVSLQGALQMIAAVGRLVDAAGPAGELVDEIRAGFGDLRSRRGPRFAYLIWKNPWMVAASETFIDAVLAAAGWDNAFRTARRYPEVTSEELREAEPDLVLLSSEPFPFARGHVAEVESEVPGARALLVDGTMLSWFGSRLARTPAYLRDLTSALG